jgi:Fur family iron response transcriptional regulator
MTMHHTPWPATRPEVTELLQAHGIMPTQQRIEIALVLLTAPQHMSAEQLHERINGLRRGVSKATVYNTLGLFAEKGLVREVIVDPGRVFYDSNTAPHHHIYNLDNTTLTDIEPTYVLVGELPPLPEGLVVEDVDVIVRVRSGERGRA